LPILLADPTILVFASAARHVVAPSVLFLRVRLSLPSPCSLSLLLAPSPSLSSFLLSLAIFLSSYLFDRGVALGAILGVP
jgi:hypothetical protein